MTGFYGPLDKKNRQTESICLTVSVENPHEVGFSRGEHARSLRR